MGLLQSWLDRVISRVNPEPTLPLAIADDGSGSAVDIGKPSPFRADPTTGGLIVAGAAGGAVATAANQTTANGYLEAIRNRLPSTFGDAGGIKIDGSGASLPVTFDVSHVGPFGDFIVCELTPLMQKAFTIGTLVNQLDSTSVSGTGALVDVNTNRLRIQNGTDAGGSALYTSVIIAQYRSGQGFDFRWTAAFNTTAANSTQIVGFGTPTNGIFVGYNGTTYGILHRNAGVDTWIAQSAWNGDKCDGTGISGFTTNPVYFNVFRTLVPFLGAGSIRIFLMNPTTGDWILVHTIRYPNTSQLLEFSDPTFHFYAHALSTTSTTNLTVYVGSYAAFLIGKKSTRGAIRNFNNRKNVTSEVALFSIRNATTVNGDANTASFTVRWINGSNDGANSDVRFRFVLNTTLGGSPSFAPKNGSTVDNGVTLTNAQSVLSIDTAGTTVTGGTELFTITMARNSTTTPVDVSMEDYQLVPGQTLTISAESRGVGSQAAAFTITGRED